MAVASPVRIDYVKDALRDVFVAALPADTPVIWGGANHPRAPRPFARLNITSGPSQIGSFVDQHRIRDAITLATITIDLATIDVLYTVRVNGIPARHVGVMGDTVDTIRDALVAAVNLLGEAVVAVATVAGEFTITPNSTGDLIVLAVVPGAPTTTVVLTQPGTFVQDTIGARRLTVSCDFFSTETDKLELGALDMAAKCLAALDLPSSLLLFKDRRVAARVITATQNLSGLEPGGAVEESQANFDVDLTAMSVLVETIDVIETIEFTQSVNGNTQQVTITEP